MGFVSKHFARSSPELSGGVLISVVLVWDTLFRSHISYTLSFWRRCGRGIWEFICFPTAAMELMLGLACISNSYINWNDPSGLLAIPFLGFGLRNGLSIVVFFFNLVLTGWAMSQFVTAI